MVHANLPPAGSTWGQGEASRSMLLILGRGEVLAGFIRSHWIGVRPPTGTVLREPAQRGTDCLGLSLAQIPSVGTVHHDQLDANSQWFLGLHWALSGTVDPNLLILWPSDRMAGHRQVPRTASLPKWFAP
jgi:hypothetical protein